MIRLLLESSELWPSRHVFSGEDALIPMRLHRLSSEDIKIRFPAFFEAMANFLHRDDRMSDFRELVWFIFNFTRQRDIPYCYNPVTGEIHFWQDAPPRIRESENFEIDNAIINLSRDA